MITDGRGQLLLEEHCAGEIARPLTEKLFALGCPYAAVTTDHPCTVYPSLSTDKAGCYTPQTAQIAYFHQISTVLPTFEEAARVTAAIADAFGHWVNPLQNGICIDIVPAGIDKAEGIRRLLALWGIDEADVIAVGDNVNDSAMIAAFPAYAVDNAVDSIKALAGRTVPDVTALIAIELSR